MMPFLILLFFAFSAHAQKLPNALVSVGVPLYLKAPVLGLDGRGRDQWIPIGTEISWNPTIAVLAKDKQRILVKVAPESGKKGQWYSVPTRILLIALQDEMGTEVASATGEADVRAGTRLVPIAVGRARPGKDPFVTVVRVDENGRMVAADGSPAATPKDATVRLDAMEYSRARVVGEAKFPRDVQANVEKQILACAAPDDPELRPWVERLANVGGPVLAEYYSPYSVFQRNRKLFLALHGGDPGKCLATLRAVEDEIFERSPWKHTNRDERVRLVYRTAKEVYATITEFGRENLKGKTSGKPYTDILNPHYFDKIVTPELATCLVLQETKERLNPFLQNYTYCENKSEPSSSAHGLGQITARVLVDLREGDEGDLIPLIFDSNQRYSSLPPKEIHAVSSIDPFLQLELILRVVNYKAKRQRWVGQGKFTDPEVVRKTVTSYDMDDSSNYVKTVVDVCLPCMNQIARKKKGDPADCYRRILK